MNLKLLHKEVQDFLKENEKLSAVELVLKGSPFGGITPQELARQLIGRQKSQKKLPTWYQAQNILFPPNLNLEQTSSEFTAKYKSELVSGNLLVDTTGGFGIDSYFFSKKMEKIIHCETNAELQQLADHNFKALEAKNIISKNTDGIQEALELKKVDWLYIDPSRRSEVKGKVFFLKDCIPNVPLILEDCFKITDNILVKTAPILDISKGLKELKYVKEIHVVAVANEVKELLWSLKKEVTRAPRIVAASIINNKTNSVNFSLKAEENAIATFTEVQNYIYEPYAAVLKTGAFNWLSEEFKVGKLHRNSHLYTSENKINFPGRKFKVLQVNPFNKTVMKRFTGIKTNVVSRNFKQTVAQLRKKYKLKEGTDRYLFCTTDINNNQIIIDCIKISN